VPPSQTETAARRPRDLRLDVFRGLAMLIILVAHVPGNTWALWIPARFGFSDATEIFVFCSGLASALAFGPAFVERGWPLGTARIAFRVWQVYWAHVGVFLATVALLAAIDLNGWGAGDLRYVTRPWVAPFFERTEEALIGLLTLRYVPGLFDILPMYLVILAMVPIVMALWRAGGGPAAAAFVVVTWGAATTAGLGLGAGALNFPATPWGEETWFFNPFGWQLVFFTGFAFGMGWLKPPLVDRRLIALAAAVLLISAPLAWHNLHQGHYFAPGSPVAVALGAARAALEPLWWKPWQGALRFVHFLALAYLAWVAVGPGGRRLVEGWSAPPRPPERRRLVALVAAPVAMLTAPYGHVGTIAALSPALDAWLLETIPVIPDGRIGLLQLLHFVALLALVAAALPDKARAWLARDGVLALIPVVRKIGTQSLAVFMVSIPLSQLCGLVIDHMGQGGFVTAAVNLTGFAVLAVTAYVCAWFKGHPWRNPAPRTAARAAATPAE
jgi:hypothetical protein